MAPNEFKHSLYLQSHRQKWHKKTTGSPMIFECLIPKIFRPSSFSGQLLAEVVCRMPVTRPLLPSMLKEPMSATVQ
jgi:hypothetical protein